MTDAGRMVEALIFASAEPLTVRDLAERLPEGTDVRATIGAVSEAYKGRGIVLEEMRGAYAFRTAPDLAWLLDRERIQHRKLSRAALETLAIIAYHQPASRAEIENIRGVGVSRGTLEQLLELDWIRLGRRREGPGRPVTYVTTRGFLDHFGLGSPADLPGLAELRAAGLIDAPMGRPTEDDDHEREPDH